MKVIRFFRLLNCVCTDISKHICLCLFIIANWFEIILFSYFNVSVWGIDFHHFKLCMGSKNILRQTSLRKSIIYTVRLYSMRKVWWFDHKHVGYNKDTEINCMGRLDTLNCSLLTQCWCIRSRDITICHATFNNQFADVLQHRCTKSLNEDWFIVDFGLFYKKENYFMKFDWKHFVANRQYMMYFNSWRWHCLN